MTPDLTRSIAFDLVQTIVDCGLVKERPFSADLSARVRRPGVSIESRWGGAILSGEDRRRRDRCIGDRSGCRLHRGLLGGAGEIGHIQVGVDGFLRNGQHPGRWETQATEVRELSATSLMEDYPVPSV